MTSLSMMMTGFDIWQPSCVGDIQSESQQRYIRCRVRRMHRLVEDCWNIFKSRVQILGSQEDIYLSSITAKENCLCLTSPNESPLRHRTLEDTSF